jgi:hydrogenase maturation protease
MKPLNGRHAEPSPTLILGIGNIIMGDEGFGVQVVRRLKELNLPDNVKVEEGGVGGFNLLGSLEGVSRVIVVDVMMADMEPGEVCFFKPGPALAEPGKRIISFHQVGILELVQMWGLLGHQPELFFLVTRPQKLEWGTELSTPLQAAVPKAVSLLEEMCRDDFASLERSLDICTS